jgi:hypothetical protein
MLQFMLHGTAEDERKQAEIKGSCSKPLQHDEALISGLK